MGGAALVLTALLIASATAAPPGSEVTPADPGPTPSSQVPADDLTEWAAEAEAEAARTVPLTGLPDDLPVGFADEVDVPVDPAVEVVRWPSSGELVLEGRGFGHGRGMSQWGAYGAAVSGLRYDAILAHYYRGTTLERRDDVRLRVRITADDDGETRVAPASGLTATAGDTALTLPSSLAGSRVTAWRVVRDGDRLVLQGHAGGWRTTAIGGATAHAGPIAFTTPAGAVRLVLGSTHREYRGAVEAVATGSGVGTRVVASLESYLRGVVPAEMPASWPAPALQAQAVAARTYARWQRTEEPGTWYDTCDSTACQVFNGAADYTAGGELIRRYDHPASDAAVGATAERILLHEGSPAFTQFTSANGGWTVRGSRPYLTSFADEYDGVVSGSPHRWRTTLTARAVAAAFPRVGRPVALRVTGRDGHGAWGGRTTSVVVVGAEGSAEVSGERFRSALGLRSSWWRVSGAAGAGHDLTGDRRADLVARRAADGSLWLYPGNGAGGFGATRPIGTGWRGMTSIRVTPDWDGDGRSDIVARSRESDLWLYSGDGAGGVSGRPIGQGWSGMNAIATPGDWDGDGRADLLARRAADGTLWLYAGAGRSGFGDVRPIGTGWSAWNLITGTSDFDGDGHADVVARRRGDGTLWLFRGDGRGGFGAVRRIGHGWGDMNTLVAPGDWDGDGRADLIARSAVDGALWFYAGNGRGEIRTVRRIGTGWTAVDAIG
ncbi:SpoIID/LytB domain-containing protein [Jiangella ureilytica]|uniref:SpoIID/LytB domain-containing protein n=1 Tax=Jiangella ureilytica TaxID=2530374 RepID=A0A4R4S073_9ACTN|nr:SpoIID/LytB domain-containing protein [Jiangella ureilytica]TDC54403.1 SpoIID/LytB domain-containing protein [Jiangella ureilytica]